jgi:hypothetical protein
VSAVWCEAVVVGFQERFRIVAVRTRTVAAASFVRSRHESQETHMNAPEQRMRVGTWVRMVIADQGTFVGFTYVDAEAGFSAKGWLDDAPPSPPSVTVRLPLGVPWEELTVEEIAAQKFDNPPGWVADFYGSQPPAGMEWGWWRDHPKLREQFHPEYPDDLQVIVHDGGPRLTKNQPELMWVRATGGEGDVFTGRLLNQPHHLTSVKLGDEIRFVLPDGSKHPLRVTDRYLAERPDWGITPCNRCGLSELFDAPSDLIRVVFPNSPADENAQMQAFTAFCGACGGILLVQARRGAGSGSDSSAPAPKPVPAATPVKKSWWQFWK